MLKTCYVCGNKEKELFEGKCYTCLNEGSKPILDLKPLNLKICNMCKKIHYKNSLYTLEELEEILPKILMKRFVIDSHYLLREVKVNNLDLEGDNVVFDVKTLCVIK